MIKLKIPSISLFFSRNLKTFQLTASSLLSLAIQLSLFTCFIFSSSSKSSRSPQSRFSNSPWYSKVDGEMKMLCSGHLDLSALVKNYAFSFYLLTATFNGHSLIVSVTSIVSFSSSIPSIFKHTQPAFHAA